MSQDFLDSQHLRVDVFHEDVACVRITEATDANNLLNVSQAHELSRQSLVEIEEQVVHLIKRLLQSLDPLDKISDRVLVAISATLAVSFELFGELLELVSDSFPASDLRLRVV